MNKGTGFCAYRLLLESQFKSRKVKYTNTESAEIKPQHIALDIFQVRFISLD